MLKTLWASNDFKLTLLSSIFCTGLTLWMWDSIHMDLLLGMALVAGPLPILNLALKIIIEHQLTTRGVSRLFIASFAGVWAFIFLMGAYMIISFFGFPEAFQEVEIVAFFLGLSLFSGLAAFQAKWRGLKRPTPRP